MIFYREKRKLAGGKCTSLNQQISPSISVFDQIHISISRLEMMQQQQEKHLGFEEQPSTNWASLLIHHIPEGIPEESLFLLLSQHGASSVRSCSPTGRMRNCAFMDFQNEGLDEKLCLHGFPK